MKDSTRAAVELTLGIVIFTCIIWTFTTVYMVDQGAISYPSFFSFTNSTGGEELLVSPVVCNGTYVPFTDIIIPGTDWGCAITTFLNWLSATLINLISYAYQMLLFGVNFAVNVLFFGWIWYGAPSGCAGAACVIPPFPEPLNFLFGIPLTLLGVFMFVDVLIHVLALIPLWRKK